MPKPLGSFEARHRELMAKITLLCVCSIITSATLVVTVIATIVKLTQ